MLRRLRPTKIVYDGACPICTGSIRWLRRLDWFDCLEFVDLLDWEKVKKAYPALALEKCQREVHVISPNGEIRSGFYGFRKLSSLLLVGWLILPILYLPGVPILGQRMYRSIAKNRKRSGARCPIHWGA
ncbi:MAG: thiol-disulfide oxidoreductase DCC family protein [bacterium]